MNFKIGDLVKFKEGTALHYYIERFKEPYKITQLNSKGEITLIPLNIPSYDEIHEIVDARDIRLVTKDEAVKLMLEQEQG